MLLIAVNQQGPPSHTLPDKGFHECSDLQRVVKTKQTKKKPYQHCLGLIANLRQTIPRGNQLLTTVRSRAAKPTAHSGPLICDTGLLCSHIWSCCAPDTPTSSPCRMPFHSCLGLT